VRNPAVSVGNEPAASPAKTTASTPKASRAQASRAQASQLKANPPKPGQSTPGQSTPGQPTSGQPKPSAAKPGQSQPGQALRATGLDGVRAIAVLAVIAFHENLPWIPGGFMGVDIFFVLSGFLITDLLAARFSRDGRVGLNTFWVRRARRLLPALAVMLVTVTAAVSVLEPDQRAAVRPALLGAVTYTSNWWQALTHVSYFQRYGPPAPFAHLWSLAVEEQFYLLWPLILTLVLVVVHRPLRRAMVAWCGALASALAMYAVYTPGSDPSFVYYSTFTHASALMIGSALALTWPLAKLAVCAERVWRRLDLVGGVCIVVLAWTMWHFSGANPAVYPFGLVLAALAAGGLVLAAAAPGWIGALLSARALRWLGVRSYGAYLWHWPVIAITAGVAVRAASSVPARINDAVLPVVLAAVSWRWLEDPILRNGFRAQLSRWRQQLLQAAKTARRAPATAMPLAVASGLLVVGCTAGYGLLNPPTGPTLQAQIEAGARLAAATARQQPPYPWWRRPGALRPPPKPPRVTGSKVVAIGDSVMLASAPELARALPGIYINAKVSRQMNDGIGLVRRLAATRRLRPVLIVALGTNGPITSSQLGQLRAAVGRSRWLILINTFVPRPWEHEVNRAIGLAARRYPNVLLVNWHAAIEHRTRLLWSDGIHPQPVGGRLYAEVVRAMVTIALRGRPHWPRQVGVPVRASSSLPHLGDARI
jgi:peptidoglycan/LPS O-acetylase OafA/YrhL